MATDVKTVLDNWSTNNFCIFKAGHEIFYHDRTVKPFPPAVIVNNSLSDKNAFNMLF